MTTIVALVALAEEYKAFQSVFEVTADHSTASQIRLEHRSGQDRVRLISILAEQMGAQSALMSADQAINEFSANMIVIIGIAGGISADLQLGDVCISNEIIDVLQNTKIVDKDGRPDVNFAPDFYSINAELLASFTFLKVHPGLSETYHEWREKGRGLATEKNLTNLLRIEGPDILIGPIGNCVGNKAG